MIATHTCISYFSFSDGSSSPLIMGWGNGGLCC